MKSTYIPTLELRSIWQNVHTVRDAWKLRPVLIEWQGVQNSLCYLEFYLFNLFIFCELVWLNSHK
jgi:hypothetical protein